MSEGDADVVNAGYDEWLAAIEDGKAYALECPNGHGSLPPQRVCPECGASELEETPLPDSGTVETHTTIHVATPDFSEDAPYAIGIVDFGIVRLTGQFRGVDPDEVEVGMRVGVDLDAAETSGEPLVVFRPA